MTIAVRYSLRFSIVIALASIPAFSQITWAQIVPDNTLSSEASLVTEGVIVQGDFVDLITGGATRGGNLFHSFLEFGVEADQRVYFAVDSNIIENIFSRVTGNTLSDIQGTLGTCQSSDCSNVGTDATLYLMNPNGIVFGPEATLDVNGSFIATTANEIEFADKGTFSATAPSIPSQQLVINPSALLFNQLNTFQPLNSIESRATLTIPEQRSLVLVGGNANASETATGNIVIQEGRLRAPGGNIEIGGIISMGRVGLAIDGTTVGIIQPDDIPRIDFTMTGEANGFAELDVTSGGGGSINIYANNINILGGSDVCAGIGSTSSCGSQATNFGTSQSQAGNILLEALDTIKIADPNSIVENDVNPGAIGNSGDIIVNAESLILENGGQLSTSTYGIGNAGRVFADVASDISMFQRTEDNNTRINSNVIGVGNSGGAGLSADKIVLENGAQIQAEVVGQGNSGDIEIQANESVVLTGSILLSDGSGFIPSAIRTDVIGEGEGGNIVIFTSSLDILERAQIISITSGKGDAGDIVVNASGDITLLNSIIIAEISGRDSPVGDGDMPVNGGDIILNANSLFLLDGSALLADNEFLGRAGDILLNIDNELILRGRGPGADNPNTIIPSQITAGIDSGGVGSSGIIDITSDQLLLTNDGFISTNTSGDGDAGDINVRANNVQLHNGARISTNSSGEGDAGTLRVQANDLIELVGTDDEGFRRTNMNANTNSSGRGGNLILESNRLIIREGAGIAVASFGTGNAGNLEIHTDSDIIVSGTSQDGTVPSRINSSSNFVDGEATGGEVLISGRSLSLINKGRIVSRSESAGEAGPINIILSDKLRLIDGDITSESQQSSGGSITIDARSAVLQEDSDIRTNSFGIDGGDITLNIPVIVLLDDSDVLAFAPEGQGGNITFNTLALLTNPLFNEELRFLQSIEELNKLDGNETVDINASGAVSGQILGVAETTFLENSLTDLSVDLSDSAELLANSCITTVSQPGGSFLVTGTNGLPTQPGDDHVANYSTENVRTITSDRAGLMEPQAVYPLADGRLVMSRDCSH